MSIHEADTRTGSIFATQQRWLLAHITLSTYFESLVSGEEYGLRASAVLDAAVAHAVASRNTADSFLKEMVNYGYIAYAPPGRDRRVRSLTVAPFPLQALVAWLCAHLTTLDGLDEGDRLGAFLARPELIAKIQPRIASGLLESRAIREPAPTFSLFTWLNEGGVVMDWLYAGLGEASPDSNRIPTSVNSIADFGDRIRLSRSHLTRKLRAAEALGSLGWMGERGKSAMWVSEGFLCEYHAQQAAKLAIIDSAFFHARYQPDPA